MAHRTSASALHAARVVLERYSLVVKPLEVLPSGRVPNLRADEACLAVVIDYATNVFQVVQHRPELRYWQERLRSGTATAPQIAAFFQRLLDAFDSLPKSNAEKVLVPMDSPPEFGSESPAMVLSKPSLEASRFIFFYYDVKPKKIVSIMRENDILDRTQIAKLVESSLGLSYACRAVPLLVEWKTKLALGNATTDEIRRCFRQIGIWLEYLPDYFGDRADELKLLS